MLPQANNVIFSLLDLIESKGFLLSAITIPENMEKKWEEVIAYWPKELKEEAEGTYEDGYLILRPENYNNLISSDTIKFNTSTAITIHEALHSCIRKNLEITRHNIYKEQNDLANKIHLYCEEAAIELLTIYIMVNDQGIEEFWNEYKISYEPAVYALAKYVNSQSNPYEFIKELILSGDSNFLAEKTKDIESQFGHIPIDILIEDDTYIRIFCDGSSN